MAENPAVRAVVLTDLARTLWEKPGDAANVLVYLDQALDLAPDYLPAAVTMADIFYKEQQWAEAERRLSPVLRRLRGEPAQMVPLFLRLAEIHEKLGRVDDAYRQLQEADKLAPGQLLVRIALGENRVQARKWRDAVAQ